MATETALKNKWLLHLRGLTLIGSGILLFMVSQNYSKPLPILFSTLSIVAGIFGLWFISSNKIQEIKRSWVIMESSADIIFGFVVIYLYFQSADIISDFVMAFVYFSFFLGFNQIISILRIFQLGRIPNITIVAARVAIAFAYGLFAVLVLFKGASSESTAIINLIGIGPVASGILIFLLCDRLYTVKENKQNEKF